MTPAAIISQARSEGVTLAPTEEGSIRAVGAPETVARWLPVIRDHKADILETLLAANAPDTALAERIRAMAMRWQYTPEELVATLEAARNDPEGWRFVVEHDERNGLAYRAIFGLPEPGIGPQTVRCCDCRHFEQTDHPHLGHCAEGQPANPAGLWSTDTRLCERFARQCVKH